MLASLAMPASAARTLRVGAYSFFKFANPACGGAALVTGFAAFRGDQCALVEFLVDGGGATTADGTAPALSPLADLQVTFKDQTGKTIFTQDVDPPAEDDPQDTYSFLIFPPEWDAPAPGNVTFTVSSKTGDTLVGQPTFQFGYNALGTRTILRQPAYDVTAGGLPPADLIVDGVTWLKYNKAAFIGSDPTDSAPNPDLVAADVSVVLTKKGGATVTKTDTADTEGNFSVTFTAAEVGDVSATAAEDFRTALKIRSTATYLDPTSGDWGTATTDTEREAFAVFESRPDRAQARTVFVSERGWVEPGEEYIHEVEYRNASATPATGVVLTDVLPDTVTFVSATPAPTSVSGNTLTWSIGTIGAGTQWPSGAGASNRILVTARAKTTAQDPQIMWKDASDTLTIAQTGQSDAASTSHGPRITTLETARYGDRPFPVVLIEYTDNKHSPAATGWTFYNRITSPENPVSL